MSSSFDVVVARYADVFANHTTLSVRRRLLQVAQGKMFHILLTFMANVTVYVFMYMIIAHNTYRLVYVSMAEATLSKLGPKTIDTFYCKQL